MTSPTAAACTTSYGAAGTLLAAKMDWEAAGRGETDQRALTRLQQLERQERRQGLAVHGQGRVERRRGRVGVRAARGGGEVRGFGRQEMEARQAS